MKKYDIIAIGGGNTGLTVVAKAAAAGKRTALIDRGPIGGLCSLNGCNPKKVLVRSTEVLEEIRQAGKFGIEVEDFRVDWSRVIDRKETFTKPVAPSTEAWLKDAKIDYLRGAPKFRSEKTLEINGETLEFESVVVATGSVPRPLSFSGADLVQTSDDILAMRKIPPRLVIIGAGVVAFEFGQVFARLGSKVTMLVHEDRALGGNEEELVDALVEHSRGLGIEFIYRAGVRSVAKENDALLLVVKTEEGLQHLLGDFVLNAAGRIPSIKELDLEKANIAYDGRGVKTDEFLRSATNPRAWAGGDAHGRMQLSPIASYEGRVIARNLVEGAKDRADYRVIPRAIYTIPAFASVGLTEKQAREQGYEVEVHSSDMTSWKVPAILGAELARAKVIEDAKAGQILGAHLLTPTAADQIHTFAMAMLGNIPAKVLRDFVYAYPTFTSATGYAV